MEKQNTCKYLHRSYEKKNLVNDSYMKLMEKKQPEKTFKDRMRKTSSQRLHTWSL